MVDGTVEAYRPKTFTEVFDNVFPFYLAIGMSYDEFWNGKPTLVYYYREAFDLKKEHENQNAWLQGMYNLKAFSTVISAFGYSLGGNKGQRPTPDFPDYPYGVTEIGKQMETEHKKQKTLEWVAKGQ